jgi:hypothetical protein
LGIRAGVFSWHKPENGINIPNGLDGKVKQEIEEED